MKLISPESLVEFQREILKGYSRFFPTGAVCVNVMLGQEPWDIRPLLLLGGKVHVVRFSMTLTEARAKQVSGELEGFSVLLKNRQKVQLLEGEGRFMVVRPFEALTLNEEIEKGALSGSAALHDIVRKLIAIVSDLSRRSLAHGHISPANISRVGSDVVLLDPVLGALHQTADIFLPPETELGTAPQPSADLYSLGRLIKILLGDALTPRQSSVVEQLLLPSPRQRPPLVEVAVAFGAQEVSFASDGSGESRGGTTGRVVKPGASSAGALTTPEAQELARQTSAQRTGEGRTWTVWLLGVLGLLIGGYYLKTKNPEVYYELASYVPFLAPAHSIEYEDDWASGDRARMAIVARAAVLRKEPAAVNTVVSNLSNGQNPKDVRASLLRVALLGPWRDQLSRVDISAAITLALDQLVPEGMSQLPALDSLHPGIILALLGQPNEIPQLRLLAQVPLSTLEKLPEPVGPLFAQLRGMGVATLGDPRARGLARIACGDDQPAAFEAYLGDEPNPSHILATISLVLPIIQTRPSAVQELLGVLGERGGEVALLLGWFDLIELPRWSSVPAVDKIRLILDLDPQARLDDTQWSDLLSFPLEGARAKAIKALKRLFPDAQGEKLLLTLATPSTGLKREEIIALVSALKLPVDKRIPFVSAWFNLKPSADAVVLLLLARNEAGDSDLFNLEGARYLRKSSWKAPIEIMNLLAAHPEPLARAIAYGRLDPTKEPERVILESRKTTESDPGCLKVLEERLKS